MQRLASFVQHVIGHIDDVVDRALASRLNGILEPLRAGADLDAFDTRRGVVRADFGGFDFDAGNERFAGASTGSAGFNLWIFYREAETCREFASDAKVAEHIDAVGSDL